jgi:epoxyqueuosine reductase
MRSEGDSEVTFSEEIKDYALDIGYHAAGIAPAHPFTQYAEALEERSDDYDWSPRLPPIADPQGTFPSAKSVVVAAYDFASVGFPTELTGRVGRIYQARCYGAPEDRIHGARNGLLRRFLEAAGCTVAPWQVGFSAVPDRPAAVRAGIAQFGRNTFACAPSIGSFIVIHSFLVDQELAYDTPAEGLHCPPKCDLCQKACPTEAITAEARMNPRRCIAFNSFTTRGDNGVSTTIPQEIRPKMGTWIHGCDVCQEVCPRNQAKQKADLPVDPYLAKKASEFDFFSLLTLTDEYYECVVKPLMYNYIRDLSVFRRNAAVALGNLGDPDSVAALAKALSDPAEVVRAHAAWALGRIGGSRARKALESSLPGEQGEKAQQEIQDALAHTP